MAKDTKIDYIAPTNPENLVSASGLAKLLRLRYYSVVELIERFQIPAANIPTEINKRPRYRYGDVLIALGVGLSPEHRYEMLKEEAKVHAKDAKKKDIERSLRF